MYHSNDDGLALDSVSDCGEKVGVHVRVVNIALKILHPSFYVGKDDREEQEVKPAFVGVI